MDQVLAHVLALFVVLIPNFFFDPYSGSTNTHVRMHALARVSLLLRHHMTEADTCSRCRSKLRLRSTRVRARLVAWGNPDGVVLASLT